MNNFYLKEDVSNIWYIYSENNILLAGPYRGDCFSAKDWAYAFISSWPRNNLFINKK